MLYFLNAICMGAIPLKKVYIIPYNPFIKSYKILEKEKYTLHTITHLAFFTRVFCHTPFENLLKGHKK